MTKNYKIHGNIGAILVKESGGYRWTNAEALAKASILHRPAIYSHLLGKYLFKKWYEEKLLHYFDGEENFAIPNFVSRLYQQAAEAHSASEALKLQLLTKAAEAAVGSTGAPVYTTTEHIDLRDIMPVYGKINGRYTTTGLDYFRRLRHSVAAASDDDYKRPYFGIGMDCIQAAALARLECAAYVRAAAHLMPLSLEAFDILLEDFGEYQKLERKYQYSAIQAVIDNDLNAGGTGRDSMYDAKSKKLAKLEAEVKTRWSAAEAAAKAAEARAAEAPRSVTVNMVKTGDEFEALLLQYAGKKRTVKIIQYRADGWSWKEISDDIGLPVKTCQNKYFEAVKKLQQVQIDIFLK